MKAEAAVFLAVIVVVSSLVFVESLPPGPKPLGWIVWSPAVASPCQGNYTGEAVIVGRPAHAGCASEWGIMIPPSEHGNLSRQGALLAASGSSLAGVFLDDFDLQNLTTQRQMLAAVPSAYGGSVCPVIYAYGNQPNVTKGMPCVALAITPRAAAAYKFLQQGEVTEPMGGSDSRTANQTTVSTWLKVFQNATGYVDAKRVMIVAFGKSFAGWSYYVPPSYVAAIKEYAADNKLTLVYFGPPQPS